jgi:hypothetical protein
MRLADADARLSAFAREWSGKTFEWGRRDCTLLAARVVDALAGTELAALYGGRWDDEQSARAFQLGFGGDAESVLRSEGLESAFTGDMACTALEERLGALRRGDLILARLRGFCCGHAVFGALSLSADPARGVVWCPTAELLAWPRAVVLRVP